MISFYVISIAFCLIIVSWLLQDKAADNIKIICIVLLTAVFSIPAKYISDIIVSKLNTLSSPKK